MTKQGMGQLVADLEKNGFVERVEDPADRRAKLVRLTKKGWRHVRDAREIIAEIEEAYAWRIGEKRLETLRDALKDLSN
jgi:DNA-binding MarR family transcriptional regulator